MKKYHYCFIVFMLVLSNIRAAISNDIWYKKAKTIKKWVKHNPDKCKNIEIDKKDSEAECFEKLIKQSVSFFDQPSEKKMNALVENSKAAIEIYPGSAVLNSWYALVLIQKGYNQNISKALKLIIPFLQEADNTPYVYRSMHYIFYFIKTNYRNTVPQLAIGNVSKLLNCYKHPEKAYRQLVLLEQYWLSKMPLSTDRKLNKKIIQAQMLVSQKRTEILLIWKTILDNLYKENRTAIELNIYKKINAELSNSKRNHQMMIKFQKSLKTFDALLTPPNSLKKIELTFNKITRYRRQLKQYKNIPIYDKLKSTFKHSEEAEVLNIAFQSYILRDYNKCMEEISKLKSKDSDTRLLAIKVYCMKKLKYPLPQIITELNKILKINPNNYRAFMLKKMLEAKLELQSRMSKKH